jgi:hypothetical protein
MKCWSCTDCKLSFPSTSEYWYQNQLDRVNQNPNRISIGGKCKPCAVIYSKKWREGIKKKGLIRSQQKLTVDANAVNGTLYAIGSGIPGDPVKLGITVGTDTRKRKAALQTAHWIELKEIWKSDLIPRVDKIEKLIHKHFSYAHVRGEWFNISQAEIESIPGLIKKFQQELEK